MMKPIARSAVRVVVPVAAALVLVACAGGTVDGAAAPTAASSAPSRAPSAGPGDGAGGTAPRAYTVDEALDAEIDGPILVTGLLIDAGNGWRLCAAIAESYPPQCGGAYVTVDGVDVAEFDLQEAGSVRWTENATVVGALDGDTLTVTGSAASS